MYYFYDHFNDKCFAFISIRVSLTVNNLIDHGYTFYIIAVRFLTKNRCELSSLNLFIFSK